MKLWWKLLLPLKLWGFFFSNAFSDNVFLNRVCLFFVKANVSLSNSACLTYLWLHVSIIYCKSESINPFPTVHVSITVYKSVCFTYIRVHVSYTQECMSHFSNSACLTYIRVHVSLTQECISHMYNRVNISLILECMSHILYIRVDVSIILDSIFHISSSACSTFLTVLIPQV